jgi:AraC-like DNA-binding protein
MFIPEAGLQQPIRTANPAINVLFTQQCEEILSSLTKVESTSAAIRLMLIQSASALLNISQAAERLHLTERTLRRRLEAEATTFRTICDEVRNLLAHKYLSNTALSVTEIAYLLSYTEPVNFRRAFARWNGMTPGQYRMLAD